MWSLAETDCNNLTDPDLLGKSLTLFARLYYTILTISLLDASASVKGDHKFAPGSFERVPCPFRVYTTLTTFRLDLSTFARKRIDYAGQSKGPASLSALTLSLESAITVASACAVSDYERASYYNGTTDEGNHPSLLYRSGSAKYPRIQRKGRFVYPPTKSLRGVYRTPLNGVWSIVGLQARQLVKDRMNLYSSIDPARFVTHGEDGGETLGPVIIWVGVYPGSTFADTAH